MKRLLALLLVMSFTVGMLSCFPRPYQQRKARLFNQLQIGMSRAEVQRLFPKMYPFRQRVQPDGLRLDIFRMQKVGWGWFFIPMPMRGDQIDFIFENNRLVEWGVPPEPTPVIAPPDSQTN